MPLFIYTNSLIGRPGEIPHKISQKNQEWRAVHSQIKPVHSGHAHRTSQQPAPLPDEMGLGSKRSQAKCEAEHHKKHISLLSVTQVPGIFTGSLPTFDPSGLGFILFFQKP